VLAEAIGSLAAALHAGPDRVAVGVDIVMTHHRAVRDGTVTAVSTPLQEGSGLASYQIVVSDEAGNRVSTARLICALRRRAPAG
jgi:uncharacterized protein (TIGR00369 family)